VLYASVEAVVEPYNPHLNKKTLTVRFQMKPQPEDERLVDEFLGNLIPGMPCSLPAHLLLALAWRHKALEQQHRAETQFWQQSNALLAKATDAVYELSKKLDRLAYEDELTEVYNRRAVFDRLSEMTALAARNAWPLSCIMIDVDHFKAINDTWGHKVGDGVLHRIAYLLKERLRASDLLGRLGGEEFLIGLPQTTLADACAVAEILRSAIELCPLFSTGKQRIPVSISLGVAAMGAQGYDLEACIAEADQALYRAKREGRNRVATLADNE
jgi:diguanylate cyclase (GGDEF)-like protein